MAETTIYEIPNYLRLKTDPATKKVILEFYDSAAAVWKNVEQLDVTIPVVIDIPVPIIFETAKTGLAADSTGVKFTSKNVKPPVSGYLTVAIEATWTASHTDSKTAIEIYDETAASVLASVSENKGTDTKSAYVAITAGNSLVVRVNVTTASATSGATTDVTKAALYFRYTLS